MKHPKFEDGPMSVASISERLVREAMLERNMKKPDARKVVAREIGVTPGTLENLSRGRLVNIDRIAARINAYAVKRIHRQIARLEHDIKVARVVAAGTDLPDFDAAQAALEKAKSLMGAQ
jgi:hypothetical protein